ncbi:hypothetical protein pEaSNUABM5_00145 [Erwinia phage pEa_SNUABM_5]|uniref:Uncharacterized protein n=1 Tax=Erwinia phage pEa_SNUABM_5 TaxID=2797313 RepID=A0A7T8IW11_9CAUD|nr:hypothetical protein MPK73_gp145 [Erwinia phage pEa_SNUABM_5]QQO90287.1 hypothetical protein pEaSNUABM5_00145 [Erwinia phage pEa_SNUABM_5]
MKSLSGSLAALAMLAARDGNWEDAARMLSQAAVAPDSELFLEESLAGNYVVAAIADSVSCTLSGSMSESVAALSAALEIQDEQDRRAALSASLYGDDEEIDVSLSSDEDEDDIDFDLGDDEEDEAISNSSSLIRFN